MVDASALASAAVERRKASAPEARTDGNVRFCVARAASVDAASDYAPLGAPPPFFYWEAEGLSCSGVANLGCADASRERWRASAPTKVGEGDRPKDGGGGL
jgi:hypothetical protein